MTWSSIVRHKHRLDPRHNCRRIFVEVLEDRALFNGTLLSSDFNGTSPWTTSTAANAVNVSLANTPGAGTVDTANTSTKSSAYVLTASRINSTASWSASFKFGPIALTNNNVANNLYTLSFDMATSTGAPVKVIITSYNASGVRTGALSQVLYPAGSSLAHFTIDTATATPDTTEGQGTFSGQDPKIGFQFIIGTPTPAGVNWKGFYAGTPDAKLTIDNLNYAKPSFYVNPSGASPGANQSPVYTTIQAAVNAAKAQGNQVGGIIAIKGGTYTERKDLYGQVHITQGGNDKEWLTLKNYPNEQPIITPASLSASGSFNGIYIAAGDSGQGDTAPSTTPAVGYVEVRGITVLGLATSGNDSALFALDPSDPRRNMNGLTATGAYDTNKPHDIRFANDTVDYLTAGGMNMQEVDRVMIENSISHDNCRFSEYAPSGISVLSRFNFESYSVPGTGQFNPYSRVVRNNIVYKNKTQTNWYFNNSLSDGNGIIIDVNHSKTSGEPFAQALGRTLVDNNRSYLNGAGGVHVYNANYVDVFNNTLYLNSTETGTKYGQLDVQSGGSYPAVTDARVYGNLVIGPDTNDEIRPLSHTGDVGFFENNFYYGGNASSITLGTFDRRLSNTDFSGLFVNVPTNNVTTALSGSVFPNLDFHLGSNSVAVNAIDTSIQDLLPYGDLDGDQRSYYPDVGAYEL